MVTTVWIMFLAEEVPVVLAIAVYSAALFLCCMVCHGEVSRLKPNPRYLTGYYLMIALGGALGGAFVAIVAPLIFDDYYELHLGLLAVCALALIAFGSDRQSVLSRGRPAWAWTCLIVAYLALAVALYRQVSGSREFAVAKSRNFYGALTVGRDFEGTSRELLWLRNGASYHGAQFTAADKRRLATTFYSQRSGGAYSREFFHFVREHLAEDGYAVLGAPGLEDGGRDWEVYYHTIVKAGFETILPYVSNLEFDNPKAYEILDSLGMWTGDSEKTRQLRKRKLVADYVVSLRLGYILVRKDSRDTGGERYRELGISLHVLNEQRFQRAFELPLPVWSHIDMSKVNSIMRPTLPTIKIWRTRSAW